MRVHGVLLGDEVADLDDRALAARAQRANLFCRVDPIQKDRVIRALRARGHVVGYLGDGINALQGRPHAALAAAAAGILGVAAVLPFTPLGALFGLLALPGHFYAALAGMTAAYLVLLEVVKRRFHARAHGRRRARRLHGA